MTGRLGHCSSFLVRLFARLFVSVFVHFFSVWLNILNCCHLCHTFFRRCQELGRSTWFMVPLCRKWTSKFLKWTSTKLSLASCRLLFLFGCFHFTFNFFYSFSPTENTQTNWNARLNCSINWNGYNNNSSRLANLSSLANVAMFLFLFQSHIHTHNYNAHTHTQSLFGHDFMKFSTDEIVQNR